MSRHLNAWTADVLGTAPDEITIRSSRSRHRNSRSLFIVEVDTNGHTGRKISFEVKFAPHDPAPRYSTALTKDSATDKWRPVETASKSRTEVPSSRTINLSRKLAAVLLVFTLLVAIPTSWQGVKLSATVVEGLWAYTWRTVDGTLNEVGYRYRFQQQAAAGQADESASPYFNTHSRLRGDGEFGYALLRYVWRKP